MFVSLTQWNAIRSYWLPTAYLIFEAHFKFFFQQFPWVLQLRRFFIKWYQKKWSIKLCINNGVWHGTLNLLHVSRCEMLHFVMSYLKQNKSHQQTLESAQNGLEIIFKALESPFESYKSKRILFSAYLIGLSVSRPKMLKRRVCDLTYSILVRTYWTISK